MNRTIQKSRKKSPTWAGKSFPVVGIGASAGGIPPLRELLAHLPANSGMGFVVVPHLDPKHESELADLLGKVGPLPVTQIRHGMKVLPDHVYVIPPNRMLTIADGTLKLSPRPGGMKPVLPINVFLRSLAEARGGVAIAMILSGSGTDGADGVRAVKAQGGVTFAQDEKSAQHNNMPAAAIATGCVDFVMPPRAMAEELVRLKGHPYIKRFTAEPSVRERGETLALHRIFDLLRAEAGVDFSHYKPPTVLRRIQRRMVLHRFLRLESYAQFLRKHPREVAALHDDVLINVTEFFRDPAMFVALHKRVCPRLLKGRASGTPIRIWVPGCSSGEEVYSLAIALLECLGRRVREFPLQFFGTDISERALERARAGMYPASIEAHVSPVRLQRYFVATPDGYQISKAIRELCVFAVQNLTKDPPFSNLDLISCRNLMIYLGPMLQRRAMATFHYALRPRGVLVLGASENIVGFENLFSEVDKHHKIYDRKPSAARQRFEYSFHAARAEPPEPARRLPALPWRELDVQKEADRLLLRRYTPAGVLVNDDLEIVQIRGHTGAYLEPSPGTPSMNLLKMAREGLFMDLRAAIQQARKRGLPVRREDVAVKTNGDWQTTNLEVIPLKGPVSKERHFLIVFETARPAPAARTSPPVSAGKRTAERKIARLQEDLVSNRDYVKSIIEDLENANENLKAANEEIQSSNEELQSTNEELETAKEELQSTNEELTTVNEELATRNSDLARLNNDLTNLLASVNLPILMLGPDRRVRRLTPMAEKVLRLLPADVGRTMAELRLPIEVTHLEQMVDEAMTTLNVREQEVQDRDGHWYLLQVWPYRTAENKADGTVMVLVDINARRRALLQAQAACDYAETIVQTVPEPLLVLDGRLRVNSANQSFYRAFKVTKAETENRLFHQLGSGQWNRRALRQALEKILPLRTRLDNFLVEHDFPKLGRRTMLVSARRLVHLQAREPLILIAIEDITERRRAELLRARLSAIVESSRSAIYAVDLAGTLTNWNAAAERIYGYSAAEALGKRLTLILPPDRRSELRALLRKRSVTSLETVRCCKDGRQIEVSSVVSPIKNATGRAIGFSFISRNITEQKHLRRLFEEHTALLASVVANVPIVLFAFDRHGKITFLEGKGLEALRLKPTQALGKSSFVIHPRLPFDDIAVRRVLAGEDVTWSGPTGIRHHETRLTPLKNNAGRVVGAIGVSIDITEHRRLEAEIQHISEFERQRLGAELHDGVAQYLVAMMMGASVLHDNLVAKSLPEAAAAKRLEQQITRALKQTRNLARELIPVELKFAGIAVALEKLVLTTKDVFGVTCAYHCQRGVHVYNEEVARQLYRIAQEALTNAAKHSRATSIRMTLAQQEGRLALTVQDNGRGISQAQAATALGLHIMHYRASIIGATLIIDSARDRGTTVTCTLKQGK